ncbi:MAG: isoprenoid biosynthesis glyoxalase ElbB [Bacteroidales bacterium]|jgi:enhancing lycopene biosynthesis protein 2|nr:isoprenoid biosynthesis glyoxalase ElbB [Bacteroidales bacterium]
MKFAVLLSGCGVYDGSEIQEVVCVLLSIKSRGHEFQCFSVDKKQYHVVNHLTKEIVLEKRNCLIESARICRGEILDVSKYQAADFDALIIPGGFGVAKNIFTYAIDGVNCSISEEIESLVLKTYSIKKPIGAICISPILLAKILKKQGVSITITVGEDKDLIDTIASIGARHKDCPVNSYIYDEQNNIVTSPAYTSAKNVYEVYQSTEALITGILKVYNSFSNK